MQANNDYENEKDSSKQCYSGLQGQVLNNRYHIGKIIEDGSFGKIF